MCAGGELVRREGSLDQSGDTYLPTAVVRCAVCGYAEFAPALGVRWRSAMAEASAPVAIPRPRLVAA